MVDYIWDNIFKRSQGPQQRRKFLKETLLFKDLKDSEIKIVEKLLHWRNYHPKEVVFNQGELGVGMYFVFKGQINIYTSDSQKEEDQLTFSTRLMAGDFMGEMALVEDNLQRTATAIAHNDCTLVGFFKPDLADLTDRHPVIATKIALRLSSVLARRLRETTQKIVDLRRELQEIQWLSSEIADEK